ncbi:MAG: hypothetical protein JO201_01400 [Verrucomicrobia bacterium]|nr:hypothetical protein [Verrucomicrobiota bacterium]
MALATRTSLLAADFDLAANASNQLGVDLYRQLATGDENPRPPPLPPWIGRVTDPR